MKKQLLISLVSLGCAQLCGTHQQYQAEVQECTANIQAKYKQVDRLHSEIDQLEQRRALKQAEASVAEAEERTHSAASAMVEGQ